jgi:hypothetical protein
MTQHEALEILKSGRNAFVTGAAGSGKTHLIKSYIDFLRQENVAVGITASTGIAATHLGGTTIHSWAGIGISSHLSAYDLEAMADKPYLAKRFEKANVLIIDEVSMLHHYRLDLVDTVLRSMKESDKPFGGMQIVLCGDFFQLPPVTGRNEPEVEFIFHSKAWADADLAICYLSEQHRQKDDALLSILNHIRSGEVPTEIHRVLETRFKSNLTPTSEKNSIEPTRLYTHNIDVDAVNVSALERIVNSESAEYLMETSGSEALVAALKKSCLAPERLLLKFGAKVMCVKNSFDEGYANGTLGVVVSCKPNQDPKIKTQDGRVITIQKASWSVEEDGKVKAELSQYPLRLAWAITVHKSQGMSLDAVEVDLSKSFELGMGYVALSRVRTLDGLTLLGINDHALKVRGDVLEFDTDLKELSEMSHKEFSSKSEEEQKKLQADFLKKIQPKKNGGKILAYEMTAELLEQRLSFGEIVAARRVTPSTIAVDIDRLMLENYQVNISYLRNSISKTHFKKVETAIKEIFEKQDKAGLDGNITLSAIKNIVGANVPYHTVQLVRAILGYVPRNS